MARAAAVVEGLQPEHQPASEDRRLTTRRHPQRGTRGRGMQHGRGRIGRDSAGANHELRDERSCEQRERQPGHAGGGWRVHRLRRYRSKRAAPEISATHIAACTASDGASANPSGGYTSQSADA